ncbi:LysR substrate-binding domain-containing protein [Arenibacterium sp. LLYu02]|uniref:LysR substrate-binding domain-containing protein n=1 Tax=Arenibacterium sp. LLYu02 TaxID=3404132 RepID=UPI003B219BF3
MRYAAGSCTESAEKITLTDLHEQDFIAFVAEDRARQRLDQILEAAHVKPNIVAETLYGATLCALVSEGVGIGLVSPYATRGLDLSRVVLKPFEPNVQVRSLLILPVDRPASQLVRDMIGALMASR